MEKFPEGKQPRRKGNLRVKRDFDREKKVEKDGERPA